MNILSHRGYWQDNAERNTEIAFSRSFALGYGTETDVRDCKGELVISHDMPGGNEILFSRFLAMADQGQRASSATLTLALNVKADGLAATMRRFLDAHENLDAFVFDMSVPDMRSYLDARIPLFTRMSEVEQQPAWLESSAGVWLDGFASEWYGNEIIGRLLDQGKRVCIVSPELHKREHRALWQRIKPLASEERLMLCTDLPEDATHFFLDKN